MTFASQSLRVDWLFQIAGTPEVASTGLHITSSGAFNATIALAAYDEAINGASLYASMSTLISTPALNWAVYSELTSVRVAATDVNGDQIGVAKIFTPTVVDNGTAGPLPQASVVLSLRTPQTLGQANYGRMYLPHTTFPPVSGSPFAAPSVTLTVATAGAVFIEDVNQMCITAGILGNVQNMSAVGAGTSKTVTRVAVGNLVDTQRRRRNRLPETYSFVDTP